MRYIVDIKGEIEGDYEIIGKYEERPQGEWVSLSNGTSTNCGRKCSLCGKVVEFSENYCPNCGAKMRTNRIGDEPFRCSVADSVETRDFDDYEDEPAPRIYRQMTGGEE